jgi:hypothetical protein
MPRAILLDGVMFANAYAVACCHSAVLCLCLAAFANME